MFNIVHFGLLFRSYVDYSVKGLLTRVFRKLLFVELDPVPKICNANRYGELTKFFSAL